MDSMRNHSDEFRNQMDEEFELITLNDDGPDKFRKPWKNCMNTEWMLTNGVH